MDISADLTELGRTHVAVISSGCKSFLDIPRTLEFLETQGVTVCTFAEGRTGPIDFPAFYTRESGSRSPMVVQDAKEAAAIICKWPHRCRKQHYSHVQILKECLTTQSSSACCSRTQFPRSFRCRKLKSITLSTKQYKRLLTKASMATPIRHSSFLESKNLRMVVAF